MEEFLSKYSEFYLKAFDLAIADMDSDIKEVLFASLSIQLVSLIKVLDEYNSKSIINKEW